jgi:hypothetical protein
MARKKLSPDSPAPPQGHNTPPPPDPVLVAMVDMILRKRALERAARELDDAIKTIRASLNMSEVYFTDTHRITFEVVTIPAHERKAVQYYKANVQPLHIPALINS